MESLPHAAISAPAAIGHMSVEGGQKGDPAEPSGPSPRCPRNRTSLRWPRMSATGPIGGTRIVVQQLAIGASFCIGQLQADVGRSVL